VTTTITIQAAAHPVRVTECCQGQGVKTRDIEPHTTETHHIWQGKGLTLVELPVSEAEKAAAALDVGAGGVTPGTHEEQGTAPEKRTIILQPMINGLPVSEHAAEAVRTSFNPSGLETVSRIKSLAAALLTEIEAQCVAKPEAGREFAVAKTNLQTASMWAVLGATKRDPAAASAA
jgi:hypothetical protein